VLIRQLVERAEQRLLLTTYAFYKGPFIKELFQLIHTRMLALPQLQVRVSRHRILSQRRHQK
jgi:hypothetical protein